MKNLTKPEKPLKVIVFDTTMRDGELTPGVKMNVQQKIRLAKLLETIGVDVIEVGYPGQYDKDFDEIVTIAKQIKTSTICGLASFKREEILRVAEAIKPANQGRIHTYTSVNIPSHREADVLATINESISLCRNLCDDVEWSAFDAPRSDPDFLCQAIEVAIRQGATTINIPDSLGLELPESFAKLMQMIGNRVPTIDKAVLSVHCHNDLGKAVENSIIGLEWGVRQIECSINGLGARKGNADLCQVILQLLKQGKYHIDIDTSLINTASKFVSEITGIPSHNQE
ncbi:2-isopropylmalate synthase [Coleofasciculus sp. E1-EBD-02]|uniref:2-isopropylmalate synthase n=1 Tax=Coleofasciculus sp. E1-EBD-02 TaxID=3068481 RepID=UPI003303272C